MQQDNFILFIKKDPIHTIKFWKQIKTSQDLSLMTLGFNVDELLRTEWNVLKHLFTENPLSKEKTMLLSGFL